MDPKAAQLDQINDLLKDEYQPNETAVECVQRLLEELGRLRAYFDVMTTRETSPKGGDR
jgi:hypothetical protein